MAIQVPIYKRQAQASGLPDVRQRASDQTDEALAGVGEGAARAVKGINDIYREQDAAAEMTAYSQLGDATRAVLEDKDAGFLNYQGQEAGARRDAAIGQYEARVKEIEDNMTNGRQKEAFRARAIAARSQFISVVDRHVVKQADIYADQAYEGAISTAGSTAVGAANRGDFDVTKDALSNLDGIIDRRAAVKKWAPDYTATQRREAQTAVHIQILDGMLEAGHSLDAAEYLRTIQSMSGGELDGEMVAKSNIEVKVRAAALRDQTTNQALSVWTKAKAGTVDSSGRRHPVSVEEAYVTALRAADDMGGSADEVENRREALRKMHVADREARRQANEPLLGRLGQILYDGGNFTTMHPDYLALDDDGKKDALKMRLAEQRDRKLLGAKIRDEQRQIDLDLEAQWGALERNGDPGSDQLTVDLRHGDFANLSERKRNEIIAKRRGVEKSIAKDGGVTIQAHDARVDAMLIKNRVSDKTVAAKIKDLIEGDYYRAKETAKDGIVSPVDEQKIIDERFKQGVIEGWLYDSKSTQVEAEVRGKRLKEANDAVNAVPGAPPPPSVPHAKKPQAMDAVPDADRKLIIEAFKKKNATPTEDQILSTYRKLHPVAK